MPYVMVPVPEEHVEDVMQFILRTIAHASLDTWDRESVAKLFADVDEAARSLLAFVARSVVDGRELSDADAARMMQLNVREIMGIRNELNALAQNTNRPHLITARSVAERLPNGRITETRTFEMDEDLAALVCAAEQADLHGAPTPAGTGE